MGEEAQGQPRSTGPLAGRPFGPKSLRGIGCPRRARAPQMRLASAPRGRPPGCGGRRGGLKTRPSRPLLRMRGPGVPPPRGPAVVGPLPARAVPPRHQRRRCGTGWARGCGAGCGWPRRWRQRVWVHRRSRVKRRAPLPSSVHGQLLPRRCHAARAAATTARGMARRLHGAPPLPKRRTTPCGGGAALAPRGAFSGSDACGRTRHCHSVHSSTRPDRCAAGSPGCHYS